MWTKSAKQVSLRHSEDGNSTIVAVFLIPLVAGEVHKCVRAQLPGAGRRQACVPTCTCVLAHMQLYNQPWKCSGILTLVRDCDPEFQSSITTRCALHFRSMSISRSRFSSRSTHRGAPSDIVGKTHSRAREHTGRVDQVEKLFVRMRTFVLGFLQGQIEDVPPIDGHREA